MKKRSLLLALSAAFLLAPIALRVAGTIGTPVSVSAADELVGKETSIGGTPSIWLVNKDAGRYALSFSINSDDTDYDGSYHDRNGSIDSNCARFKDLNIWSEHLYFVLADGTEEEFVPFETSHARVVINASKTFQIDFTLPVGYDLSNIKGLKILAGTQVPTLAYAMNSATSKYSVNTVFELAKDSVYTLDPNPTYKDENIKPGANPFIISKDYKITGRAFELGANAMSAWLVNASAGRYALAMTPSDSDNDYTGSADYHSGNDPEAARFAKLKLWENQIYFILSDGTEQAMKAYESGHNRVIINSRRFQIDFVLSSGFDLSSIVGVRIKKGTQIPTMAFLTGNATKYSTDTVLEMSRDVVYSISPKDGYEPTKPGSNPFVFSDYTGYERTHSPVSLLNANFTLLKNGSQANRYRLYMRLPSDQVDFDQIDPSIIDGAVNNTYIAGLNWKRNQIFFDEETIAPQTTHEGYVSFSKGEGVGVISYDFVVALDGAKTLLIRAGTELPSLAYAQGVPNADNADTKKVYTVEEDIVINLTANPDYAGASGSDPFILSAPISLNSLKDTAKAELDTVVVGDYLEEEQAKVQEAIDNGKAAIDAATSVQGVQDALKAAQDTIATFKKASYYRDLAAANAVVEKIDAIGEVTLASGDAIEAARSAYDALSDDAKALVDSEKLALLEQAEADYKELVLADQVEKAIAKINAIGDVSITSEAAIKEARAAYDALPEDGKARVSEELVAKLEAAEARLAELKASKAAANIVIERIEAIGTVTLEKERAIVMAREAYDSLSEEAKSFVPADVLQILVSAEARLAELKIEQANQDAANDVKDLINAIGTVTRDSEAAIEAARSAYDALSDEAKAMVGADALKVLTDAEARLEQIKNGKAGCGGSIAGTSFALAGLALALVAVLAKKKRD